jgi:hypothetical protein
LRESGESEEQDECRQDSLDHCSTVASATTRNQEAGEECASGGMLLALRLERWRNWSFM